MMSFCGIVSQGGLPFMSGQASVFLLSRPASTAFAREAIPVSVDLSNVKC